MTKKCLINAEKELQIKELELKENLSERRIKKFSYNKYLEMEKCCHMTQKNLIVYYLN
jgi:hypothetical protein